MNDSIITVGTSTSTGGKVLTGSSGLKAGGKSVALIGDMATCCCGMLICKKQGKILQSSPRSVYTPEGFLAKAGDLVDTGCSTCFLLSSHHQIALDSSSNALHGTYENINYKDGNLDTHLNIRELSTIPQEIGNSSVLFYENYVLEAKYQAIDDGEYELAMCELKNNPLEFMKANSLVIGYFDSDMPTYFNKITRNKYQISTTQAEKSTRINVDYLPVIQEGSVDVKNHLGLTLSSLDSSLLVTPLLTGCSIAIKKHKGEYYISHIQPSNTNENADKILNKRLVKEGYKVYGPCNYGGKPSTFIGIKQDSKWYFFAQKRESGRKIKARKLWKVRISL